MASDERLSGSLQESVLTLLAFDKEHGTVAAAILEPEHFDDLYREIAERVIAYRRRFRQPPGAAHVDDLFDHVLGDPNAKGHKVYTRILSGIIEQAKTLNGAYVASRVVEFVRRQSLKQAVYEAGMRYQNGPQEGIVADVERIFLKGLKTQSVDMSPGTKLNDKRSALRFLEDPPVTWRTGMPEFDRVGLCPTEGEMLLFLAPKGRGKSTFATATGVQCLMQGAAVVHISTENREKRAVQKYFQTFFAMGKRDEEYNETKFEFDSLGRLSGFSHHKGRPVLNFDDPAVHKKLGHKIEQWGSRIGNLYVKEFSSGKLTPAALDAYLDMLFTVHGFSPDVCIIDSPDLMHVDRRAMRESVGLNYVEVRGVFGERKVAGIVTTQSNRSGAEAATVTEGNVAEDYTKLQTADNVMIYSRTAAEERLGLARLYADKGRNDRDHFTVLISQNYNIGQFVVDSTYMSADYWDVLKTYKSDGEE